MRLFGRNDASVDMVVAKNICHGQYGSSFHAGRVGRVTFRHWSYSAGRTIIPTSRPCKIYVVTFPPGV